MWCEVCHCDTTARVSIDNASLRCATCGSEIRSTTSSAQTAAQPASVVHPHDVLARWARDELLSGPNRLPMIAPVNRLSGTLSIPDSRGESSGIAASSPDTTVTGHLRTEHGETAGDQPSHRTELQHSINPQDAFTVAAPTTLDTQRAEWLSSAGQYLAYAGVAVLTVGGGIVLWSHFAAVTAATPTGWLLCLLGQMLLFLGVVTLVAAGLEQIRGEIRHQFQQIATSAERHSTNHHRPESRGDVGSSVATTSPAGTFAPKSPSSSLGNLERRAG